MSRSRELYRDRIALAVELLSELSKRAEVTREEAVELLKRKYSELDLSPLRGAAIPSDIFDKEMATLFVVGKYGMGLDQDYPALFEELFSKEARYEEAARVIRDPALPLDERRARVRALVGELNGNELSRIFRVVFTKVVLGFGSEEELRSLLSCAMEVFPEFEREIAKYAKFYIGFKIAEKISSGEIADKISKEAEKQALNISLGLGKTIPDDEYIGTIAAGVFKVPRRTLRRLLGARW
ncbi:MAG: DUF2192 domain-containing protein, partial [Fervidicoccaceae archaeon]